MDAKMKIRLPLRKALAADAKNFDTKYGMEKEDAVGTHLLKLFYFSNDDKVIFGIKPADGSFELREQIYRNDLRQKVSEYFQFGFKIREWE